MSERIQLRRTEGWRKPEGVIVVARPHRWGNPFALGTPTALARVPAIDGSPWEHEGRISAAGARHDVHHADGTVTVHHVRYLTREECVEMFRRALLHPTPHLRLAVRAYEKQPRGPRKFIGPEFLTADKARAELAGRDLACWCPLHVACHADVLLEIANAPAPASTTTDTEDQHA